MRRHWLVWLLAFAGTVVPAFAAAQPQGAAVRVPLTVDQVLLTIVDPLSGLDQVTVTVEDLSEAGTAGCRMTSDGIRLAAVRPLLDGGIRVVNKPLLRAGSNPATSDASTAADLYVNVNVLTMPNGVCVASARIELLDHNLVGLDHLKAARGELLLTLADVQLVSVGTLMTGPRTDFSERINGWVRTTVDNLVTRIKLAGQTR